MLQRNIQDKLCFKRIKRERNSLDTSRMKELPTAKKHLGRERELITVEAGQGFQ